MRHRSCVRAFTLVELLIVIGIIAMLMGLLLPALVRVRVQATTVSSLSNLRQLGIGVEIYRVENDGAYPVAAWPAVAGQPRIRWADAIYPAVPNADVFLSPFLDEIQVKRMRKPFAHTCNPDGTTRPDTTYFGGYGYNYQYLGNGRFSAGAPAPYNTPYVARNVKNLSRTLLIADTEGSQDGHAAGEGVYVIDPPLQSLAMGSMGSRKSPALPAATGNFGYRGGNDGEAVDSPKRSIPASRADGKVSAVFCDGHAQTLSLERLNDSNDDAEPDNGLWNTLGDPRPSIR